MRLRLFAAVAALLSASFAAHAADITYNLVENAVGASATGTVTTDGTIGVLHSGDIVGYSITVSNGTMSNTVYLSPAFKLLASDLTATNSGLYFNFSGSDGGGVLFSDSGTNNYLCIASQSIECNSSEGTVIEGGIVIQVNDMGYISSVMQGVQEIGTAIPTTTPEPSAIVLLGTTVLGAAGVLRRRQLI